jgi:hypothetical protein
VFILELYTGKRSGVRTPLDQFTIDGCSLADAKIHAKSIMRNVRFGGKTATLCVVRNKGNSIRYEIRDDADWTEGEKRPAR